MSRFAVTVRAMTLLETVVTIALVGMLLPVALQLVAAARTHRAQANYQRDAVTLAREVAADTLALPYDDPQPAMGWFGRHTRRDVADYQGYVEGIPLDFDGVPRIGLLGWFRFVNVSQVTPDDLQTSGAPPASGVRRLDVIVMRSGERPIVLTVFRTRAWDEARD